MSINVLYGFLATLFTWGVTALGAATVIFLKKPDKKLLQISLGFSAGVMIAASFWSLLDPALKLAAETSKMPPILVVTGGFSVGTVFLLISDKTLNKLNLLKNTKAKKRNLLLFTSITLHNIPEGLAVGVAFGSVKAGNREALLGAVTVAIGIAIQNFPEGAAVSLPFRQAGFSRYKSFMLGQASALVEPIFGLLGALLVVKIKQLLPFALSFAAGAMILVAVHEIIPECQSGKKDNEYLSTLGIMAGFTVMMALDVLLG